MAVLEKNTKIPHPVHPSVLIMEDHDEAYHAWRQRKVLGRTLLHFDAHIDFAWITPEPDILFNETTLEGLHKKIQQTPFWNLARKPRASQIHIGNYIHQAIQDGIVDEFIWVYPDAQDSKQQTEVAGRILKEIKTTAIGEYHIREGSAEGTFEGSIYNRTFRVVPFSFCSRLNFSRNVLVDIDVDFFFVRSFYGSTYPYGNLENPYPWITPREFVDRLPVKQETLDCVTIAYSVEEGYTPLRLKFLGDELKLTLDKSLTEDDTRVYQTLHEALALEAKGSPQNAIHIIRSSVHTGLTNAALEFNLAMLFLKTGDNINAVRSYQKAIQLDSSYRTPYNHPGIIYQQLGLRDLARQSFNEMLRVDPDHPHYRFFEIEEAIEEKNWGEALRLGQELLDQNFANDDLKLLLAEACAALHEYPKAWHYLSPYQEREDGYPITRYLKIKAHIAVKLGRRQIAIKTYQELLKRRVQKPSVHWALCRLHWKNNNLYKARKHGIKWLRTLCLTPFFQWRHRLKRFGIFHDLFTE